MKQEFIIFGCKLTPSLKTSGFDVYQIVDVEETENIDGEKVKTGKTHKSDKFIGYDMPLEIAGKKIAHDLSLSEAETSEVCELVSRYEKASHMVVNEIKKLLTENK